MPQARSQTSHACRRAVLALRGRVRASRSRCPAPRQRSASRQWSMFEDHPYLVRSGPGRARRDADEIEALGADTLRVEVKWNEVAPEPGREDRAVVRRHRPGRLSGLRALRRPRARGDREGLRVMLITLAPDAPRLGDGRRARRQLQGRLARLRRLRARGRARATPAPSRACPKVSYWSIWNEPNHIFFIKPRSQAPRVYRRLVERGAARAEGHGRPRARRSSSASWRRSAPRRR